MLEAAGHGRGCSELLASSDDNSATYGGLLLERPWRPRRSLVRRCQWLPPLPTRGRLVRVASIVEHNRVQGKHVWVREEHSTGRVQIGSGRSLGLHLLCSARLLLVLPTAKPVLLIPPLFHVDPRPSPYTWKFFNHCLALLALYRTRERQSRRGEVDVCLYYTLESCSASHAPANNR